MFRRALSVAVTACFVMVQSAAGDHSPLVWMGAEMQPATSPLSMLQPATSPLSVIQPATSPLSVLQPPLSPISGIQPLPSDGSRGWERHGTSAPGPARSWPATIGENFSSPMFYDLNGDGRLEVIATDRGHAYVFDSSGVLLPGWPRVGGSDNAPAVADIDGDGSPEIFIASPDGPPKIRCFNTDGSVQTGFPVNMPWQTWLNVSSPVIADVDGDGHLDVGAQSETGVAFFDRHGLPLPGWPYRWTTSQNIVWSAPAVADLDGDGLLEVVVGNNCLYNCSVHAIRFDGTVMPGWPVRTENIFSSAAAGDLDADGDLEIVIQEGDPTWYGNRLHVLHHDGTTVAGWPREIAPQWESSRSNPAIADIDNDGQPEIVTQTADRMLHAIHLDGVELHGYPRMLPGEGSISSVQVIDMDADGIEEIFLCYYKNGSQWVSGWTVGGATLAGFPKLLFAGSELNTHGSACFGDLEGDGDLDLCAQGQAFGAGRVCVYEVDNSVFGEASRRDWPKIRHDDRNTGHFEALDPAAVDDPWISNPRLTCFPNPAAIGDEIWLSFSNLISRDPTALSGIVDVDLFDSSGRRVWHSDIDLEPSRGDDDGPEGSGAFSVRPILGDRAGAYFVRVTSHGGRLTQTEKLVLVRR